MEHMKSEEIIKLFKEKFNDSITNSRIEIKTAGLKKNSYSVIWLEIELKDFKEAVKLLCTIQFPHFAIISGSDTCLLYTSDAADEEDSVDLGGRRIIKKKKIKTIKKII